ncbi:MAG: tRNA 2-thiouridine(34) synthase MnmA [Anaerolineae bacterium]|nr:tRNA 2-thiouridine(34) synthase MnmA [Anaerolineae bacterium]
MHPKSVAEAMHPKSIAVALSGGIDSAMAAALLIEKGHRVIGITMRTWQEPPEGELHALSDPAASAQRVANALRIPLHIVDAVQPFKHQVVERFISEYSAARTPNPCLYCNRHIKFGYLLQQALHLGAEKFATGHYARIQLASDGRTWQLSKGIDGRKDQSYVLYMLGQKELGRVLFPLGNLTKDRVREMAVERQLPVAHVEESQDLCFVCDNDYRRFLQRFAPQSLKSGPILDSTGHQVGQHKGLAAYTVGQRSGLGISAPQALYVLRLDAGRNALIVGPKSELGCDRLLAHEVHWVNERPPIKALDVMAKIRYKARPARAVVTPLVGNRAQVQFAGPLRDITPGQGVVFYGLSAQANVVLGGGLIES